MLESAAVTTVNIKSATPEPSTRSTSTTAPDPEPTPVRALWPVDKLFIFYTMVTGLLLAFIVRRDPSVLLVIFGHIAAIGMIFVLGRYASGIMLFIRHWYILVFVPVCYKEIPYLVVKLSLRSADPILARWDRTIGGTTLVFWLGSVQNRALTEFLQIIYSLFIPGVVALSILYWYRQSRAEFRRAGFLISAMFLISYLGYLVLPARGPHFIDYSLPALQGLWTFHFLQGAIDSLEGVQYDCFPSGHVAVVMVGCYVARRISPAIFWVFCTFTGLIALSTIYLHYHYVIDVLAGIVLAMLLLLVFNSVYKMLDPVEKN